MNLKSRLAFVLALGASSITAALGGCELVSNVDRGKIGSGGSGGAIGTGGASSSSSSSSGTGGTTGCVDPAADCPATGTACVTATCDNGACATTNAAAGAACSDNGGKLCDGDGACVACLTDTDCANFPAEVCDAAACVPAACTDGKKDGAETDVDCGGNGGCNPCDNGLTCGGNDDCASGFCDGTACAPCAADMDCNAGSYCDAATSACKPAQADGAACTSTSQCTSGFCADGFCCDTACSGTCQACSAATKGSGADGACGPIAVKTDPKTGCSPYFCDGNGACATTCAADSDCIAADYCGGSACAPKKAQGAACGANNECANGICADGVCCNTACTGTCQACNVAGSLGTCSDVPAGQQDANSNCTGTSSCNGSGTCAKTNGQTCTMSTECGSGFCADGVCCNNSCTGTCRSCNLAGTVGTCSFIPLNGSDANPVCGGGTQTCNGAGACLLLAGQACTMNSQCLNGNCLGNNTCN